MVDLLFAGSWIILVAPLACFLVIGCCLRRAPLLVATLAVAGNGLATLWAVALGLAYAGHGEGQAVVQVLPWSFTWFELTPALSATIGCLLDPISVMMLMVITLIATLVNIYSVGYMRGDPGAGRFFALLSFFTFSMLGLVIAPNLLQMFVFWELVGVASYLLIGFWHHKPSAVAASKKAFIVTRFADAFFLLGLVIAGAAIGDLDFAVLNDPAALARLEEAVGGLWGIPAVTLAGLLIFTGGWGKSAMFPLHIWLPDAMEGPTPVSSIIHSATMVVAGVYLVARLFPFFAASDHTLLVVEATGAFTALFAAVIACTQFDIKRILAFSTLSQLGYMMLSLGVASAEHPLGYSAAMFHVFTHAFFKCLLFLGAGLVIHAVHSNDLRQMGGLGPKLPVTRVCAAIAVLAIAGVFPFAGFFSKDEILIAAFAAGHQWTGLVALAVGGLTAFYMARYFILIFQGSYRGDPEHLAQVHEDRFMTLPMVVLAMPSLLAGLLAKDTFLHHVLPAMVLPAAHHEAHFGWIPWAATGLALVGLVAAWVRYRGGYRDRQATGLHRLVLDKFYIDELYLVVTRRILFDRIAAPARWCDERVVDGSINFGVYLTQGFGMLVRWWQNGQVHRYLAVMLVAVFLCGLLGGWLL